MKYLKLFENHSQYEDYVASGLTLPNVSHCIQEVEVHYNPFVETRVVCKYNVTSTSEPTALRTNFEQNIFKSMEVDGLMLDELVTAYTFDSTGVHTVKYELYDETKLGNHAPTFYNGNLIEATIPSGVTSIGDNAFYQCSRLTSIDIPSGVTSIGGNAFASCSSLTSVSIDSNAIVSSAYTSSTNMKNIFGSQVEEYVIGDSVTSIGIQAFYGCSGLTSVAIGSGVTSIGSAAFQDCRGLTSIDIPNSVTTIATAAFYNCSGLTSINIPSGVTIISDYTFSGCRGLTSCTFEEGSQLTSIGSGAFQYCSNLTIIDIPDSVTSIGSNAFNSCSGLTSINIPSGVTSIGNTAFSSCSGLTSITIDAETPPTLGNYAFDGTNNCPIYVPSCESVVTYMNSWSEYASRISAVGGGCGNVITYASSSKLSETTASKSSGLHTNAFSGSSGQLTITSHEFSNGVGTVIFNGDVTTIGENAFYGCNSLTNIVIPDSVTSIGIGAFYNCSGLISITIDATTPPTLGYNAFENTNSCLIYVPSGSVQAYKTRWSTYANRIQAIQ